MTWRRLGVPYHSQDGSNYCGPAVAQMVGAYFGRRAAGVDQAQEMAIARQHNQIKSGEFVTDPVGLEALLRRATSHLLPPARPAYRFERHLNALDATRRILASVALGYPACTLIDQGHWCVVEGYQTMPAAVPSGRRLSWIWLNSPRPNNYAPPIPPHADPDECGIRFNTGTLQDGVDLREWYGPTLEESFAASHFFGKPFVSVAVDGPDFPYEIEASAEKEGGFEPAFHFEALTLRLRGFLEASGESIDAQVPLTPGAANLEEVVAVHVRGDDATEDYHLGRIGGVGGGVGWVLLRNTAQPIRRVGFYGAAGWTWRSSAAEARAVAAQRFPGRTIEVVSERLEWTPSQEFRSPSQPFREIRFADGGRAYVGLDGRLHTQLTEPRPGG